MSGTVELLPSGRSFTVAPNRTLLECALGAGISLDYGCANGSCGCCKARVVSGSVVDARFHDYVISAREKLEGFVLLCSTEASGDVVIEASMAGGVKDIALQTIKARFSSLVTSGSSTVIVDIRTPRSRVLRFLAGQQVCLTFPSQQTTMLSLANCPCDGMNLEFHLPTDLPAPLSMDVLTGLKKGDVVGVRGPFGTFVLDENAPRALIFVAVDSAFAPVRSLIEQAMNLELPQPMYLWRLTREKGDPYLHNLCRSWADFWDGFSYRTLPIEHNPNWTSTLSCFLDELDLPGADLYLSGRHESIAPIERLLTQRKALPGRVFVNEFERSRF